MIYLHLLFNHVVSLLPEKKKTEDTTDFQTQWEEMMKKIPGGVKIDDIPSGGGGLIWDPNQVILGPGDYIGNAPTILEDPNMFKVDVNSLPRYSNGYCHRADSSADVADVTVKSNSYTLLAGNAYQTSKASITSATDYITSKLL